MVEIHCLEPLNLERFLERRRASPSFPLEMSLAENLVAVLKKAEEFVPSEAGSLLLDDPTHKQVDRGHNQLTFIGVFGERSKNLIGQRIPAGKGIAGHVYTTGKSYCTSTLEDDELFDYSFDESNEYETRSLVAIPVRIEHEVCGVLELINRKNADGYSQQDLNLLDIFAGYISVSIQNVLDGRQAQEIAKRDNLTGLFNDRYLHIALSRAISECWERSDDLSLIFLDLDFFKRVNDTHGHLAGSQVLREVGSLLRSAAPTADSIIARYGGDEFVISVPGMDLHGAIDLAESVRNAIVEAIYCAQPGDIQPDPLNLTGITCSCGIASLRRHVNSDHSVERAKSTLLRLADSAMYVAKETGRNRTAVAGEVVARRATPYRIDPV